MMARLVGLAFFLPRTGYIVTLDPPVLPVIFVIEIEKQSQGK